MPPINPLPQTSLKELVILNSVASTLARIADVAVIPVLRVPSPEDALFAAEGIVAGGLPVVEVTLTIPDAFSVIRELSTRFGSRILVGAGTVLGEAACTAAIDAGAQFIVSPAFEPSVVAVARSADRAVFPGAMTPTEVVHAAKSGADAIKVFPANALGGPSYIRALRGPLPHIPLIVTGGVTAANTADFLAAGVLAVGAGESILPRAALDARDTEAIAANALVYVNAVRSYRRLPALLSPIPVA
jgi:2-dehydro-3-deoxyphosphogluconate aldolase/(4S)-4-hydroxy-2-oxoglutarate aldolase